MSYTKGPWKACTPRFGYQAVRQDPEDWDGRGYQLICHVPQATKGSHYGKMFEANARLIAAAPDLLKALDNLATAADTSELMLRKHYEAEAGYLRQRVAEAISAIKKATG